MACINKITAEQIPISSACGIDTLFYCSNLRLIYRKLTSALSAILNNFSNFFNGTWPVWQIYQIAKTTGDD